MNEQLAQRIASFLDGHHVLSLATGGPGGPHAASLFYVRDGLALIWVSDPASRHSGAVVECPDVAATVAPDYRDFPDIKGLQLSGTVRRLEDADEIARARELMLSRFAFLRTAASPGSPLRSAYERARFYRLAPTRIVLIDNSRGFGSKEILELVSEA